MNRKQLDKEWRKLDKEYERIIKESQYTYYLGLIVTGVIIAGWVIALLLVGCSSPDFSSAEVSHDARSEGYVTNDVTGDSSSSSDSVVTEALPIHDASIEEGSFYDAVDDIPFEKSEDSKPDIVTQLECIRKTIEDQYCHGEEPFAWDCNCNDCPEVSSCILLWQGTYCCLENIEPR